MPNHQTSRQAGRQSVQQVYRNEGPGNVNVEVSFQYPKGNFRFPVIPDRTSKRGPVKREQLQGTEARTMGRGLKPVKAASLKKIEKRQPAEPYAQKRPFRITEVPSPVYGFQKRPIPEADQESVEYELPEKRTDFTNETDIPAILRKEKDREGKGVSLSNQEINAASRDREKILVPPVVEEKAYVSPVDDAQLDLASQEVALTESIEGQTLEEVTRTAAEAQSYADLPIENEDLSCEGHVSPQQSEDTHTAVRETEEKIFKQEEPKSKHIPFNVIMLSKDKQKWSGKRTEEEKKTAKVEEVNDEPVHHEYALSEEPADIPYYCFPSMDLLAPPLAAENDNAWLKMQEQILNETLHNFNVKAKVVNATQGPAVTQFEVQPEPGVKVNKITNLTDDIKLSLAAQDIRMEAPIPGKHTIGIEIPNRRSKPVFLREILESRVFQENDSPLTVALGLDITGSPIVTDLRKMPHGLIAGATGSGKSVCINTMLISLLYKATPQDVKLLLIDPKVVELAPYNHIPHLVSPVITDVKAATAALKWAVEEMERRYELFAHAGVRDIGRFNQKAIEAKQFSDKLPFIVIVIDELADLMMVSPADVEESICRIAQKARACGIHLIVATQRPSVDVITGLIKSNIPTRIAFSVSSQIDSRTIIDSSGAEKLLGRGDMLFLENGSSKTIRLQGTFVDDDEIEEIVHFVKREQGPQYLFKQEDLLGKAQIPEDRDELFLEACEFVVEQNTASTSGLQRRFHIGYSRAGRLIDMMESHGIISGTKGSKPREVLMTAEQYEEWISRETERA
ncbi:MAG: DNA translocase FtsK [Bacillus sp. (in: firmicutes)]